MGKRPTARRHSDGLLALGKTSAALRGAGSMKQLSQKYALETVNGSMVTFRVSENWVNLNQYEQDDSISGWINRGSNSRAIIG